ARRLRALPPLSPPARRGPLGVRAVPRVAAARRRIRDGREALPVTAPSSPGLEERTIRDLGEPWTHYGGDEGFYGSPELLADIVAPFLSPTDFRDKRVAEIG